MSKLKYPIIDWEKFIGLCKPVEFKINEDNVYTFDDSEVGFKFYDYESVSVKPLGKYYKPYQSYVSPSGDFVAAYFDENYKIEKGGINQTDSEDPKYILKLLIYGKEYHWYERIYKRYDMSDLINKLYKEFMYRHIMFKISEAFRNLEYTKIWEPI